MISSAAVRTRWLFSWRSWASLNSTTSRPFPKPKTGKIAIKVINHYGDEVLKVFEI
jgi:adenine-specific DNA-methyltransferase